MTCLPVALPRLRARLTEMIARFPYAVSALDRIGLSLFSFVLSLVLLRVLTATEFGIVSLWMTLALFALDLQGALVSTPLNVHVPGTADPIAASQLEGAAATVNVGLVALVTVVAFAATALLAATGAEFTDLAVVAAIPVYIATGMYREYQRSIAFGRRDMALLLWVDGPYLVVTTLCLAAMLVWRHQLGTVAVAFFAMSLGSIASQLWLHLRRHRRRRPTLFARGWIAAYRRIISEIGWSLLGVAASHVQGRSYVYIATSLAGLAALAAINVVNVLFRPLKLLVSSWNRSALPQLSAMLAKGEVAAFERSLRRALLLAAIGSIAWFFALQFGWHTVSHRLLAHRYPDARMLLLPCAAASAMELFDSVVSAGLAAARQFRFLAQMSIVSGVIAAVATTGMILWQGYPGAMWGVAIGNAASVAMAVGRLWLARRPLTEGLPLPIDADYPTPIAGEGN